ncbi:hypothetical protein [Streptococcus merionis]|uniref:Anti-bacteriophage protein A/HamA C-terminal domain-containing protein n=1 Tax=Streptococcus merionis TaxID=400065 RepID=A0A239SWK9_9STRE|nr:hypothetical protein [Streptococcus merionis]SNU89228.1 Uncharacterised protein [Streptococcus merionis]
MRKNDGISILENERGKIVKLLENRRLTKEGFSNVIFIRVEPSDLETTISEIINHFQNMSWIDKFDENYKKRSFQSRSLPTVKFLKEKLENHASDRITTDIGETVVSELSRSSLINQLDYLDVPLGELIKQQISGNSGFDFFSETKNSVIVFGEAKYLSKKNAYGNAMEQVERFVVESRDISDLRDIEDFVSLSGLRNASDGVKAYACGFSSTQIDTKNLINHIIKNRYFSTLAKHNEVIYIAVNILI